MPKLKEQVRSALCDNNDDSLNALLDDNNISANKIISIISTTDPRVTDGEVKMFQVFWRE